MNARIDVRPLDLTDKIIAFESGELDQQDIFELFAGLVYTGLAWTLQGTYGRTASSLIEAGYITPAGRLTDKALEA
jgi:hypothetical protein